MRGFSLIEQIVTLAITASLIGSAVPAMSNVLRENQAQVATRSLLQALRSTRMLAIERQRNVLLCPSNDGRHCSGQQQWQHGWLIGLDRDNDGQPDHGPLITQPPLRGARILGSHNRTRVRYHADGSAPGSNLTLLICPNHNNTATVRSVVVSNAGRVRLGHARAQRCH